jgi:hypothetical protein
VQVRCDEGVASHIGPEPCAGIREDVGEASVGEHIGQPLSHESISFPGADAVVKAEGNMAERAFVSDAPAWSQTLACVHAPCTGTGRSRV